MTGGRTRVSVHPVPVAGRHNINTYLLVGARPILVDAGMPGSGRKIVDGIAEHGVDPGNLALIVLTHAHIDHFGAAAQVSRLTGAPIAAHRADLGPYRAGRAREPYLPTGPFGAMMSRMPALHRTVQPVEPDLVLDGPHRLDDFGVAGRIVPTPGHTAGSVSVLTDDGDLVAGDLIAGSFLGSIIGRPANPPFHDDPVANLASLRAMLALRPAALQVGHGGRLEPGRVTRWLHGGAVSQHRAAESGLDPADEKEHLIVEALLDPLLVGGHVLGGERPVLGETQQDDEHQGVLSIGPDRAGAAAVS